MIADVTVADIERRFPPAKCEAAEVAPTGEPFVIVASGGQKTDADKWPALCSSEEAAATLWAAAFEDYASGKTGALYWHTKPTLETFHMTMADKQNTQRLVTDRFVVWAKLLLSDQPAQEKAA